MKLTAVPNNKTNASIAVKLNPNFTSFSKLAPNIVGIAKKNVNSAATVLDNPMAIPPKIVAPERDVPGNIAAITWNNPTIKACL